MPFTHSNDKLLEVMTGWQAVGIKAAVILVDESQSDGNASNDRADQHHMQAQVLLHAVKLGFPIFLVAFGATGLGDKDVFTGGLGSELDTAIPGQTYFYRKGLYETNAFTNATLKKDVQASGAMEIIIMGQSVNACCAATARGVQDSLGLDTHTCPLVVRGGSFKTEAPMQALQSGWPDSTTVYAAI